LFSEAAFIELQPFAKMMAVIVDFCQIRKPMKSDCFGHPHGCEGYCSTLTAH
jgi:hypothetical protein